FIQHGRAAPADLRHGDALGEALGGIEFTQTLQAGHRVRLAHAGEAPTADRGAHQTARLRRLGEPLTEDGHVQPISMSYPALPEAPRHWVSRVWTWISAGCRPASRIRARARAPARSVRAGSGT